MTVPNIHSPIEKLAVPTDGLVHYGRNPRRGNVPAIVESPKHNGQYKPIVVHAETNEVLAGNHMLKAAREMGWDQIAATFVDVDEDEAARIVLVDNRTNDIAGYDDGELAELLELLPTLDGTGFDAASVEKLVHGTEQEPAEAPDRADELSNTAAISQLGQVYELGDHRVVCGDATDPGVLASLLGEERPDMMWTDPPYGVEYQDKTEKVLRIKNDGADDLETLLPDPLPQRSECCAPERQTTLRTRIPGARPGSWSART